MFSLPWAVSLSLIGLRDVSIRPHHYLEERSWGLCGQYVVAVQTLDALEAGHDYLLKWNVYERRDQDLYRLKAKEGGISGKTDAYAL
jgi:hypothetical protein